MEFPRPHSHSKGLVKEYVRGGIFVENRFFFMHPPPAPSTSNLFMTIPLFAPPIVGSCGANLFMAPLSHFFSGFYCWSPSPYTPRHILNDRSLNDQSLRNRILMATDRTMFLTKSHVILLILNCRFKSKQHFSPVFTSSPVRLFLTECNGRGLFRFLRSRNEKKVYLSDHQKKMQAVISRYFVDKNVI